MTTVALCCVQPVLAEGLAAVLAGSGDLSLSAGCTTLSELTEHVRKERPDLILVDVAPDVTFDLLATLRSVARQIPIVLWVTEDVSPDFASQAIALGVRGILRKSLSVELQLKCLRKVAAGEFWVEKALSEDLLCTRRVPFTSRERQAMILLAHGLKNKEIAYEMGLSEGTVKVYLSRLFRKVGASDRLELALFGVKNMLMAGSGAPENAAAPSVDSGSPRLVSDSASQFLVRGPAPAGSRA
jgi:two-component system, NarL family, nitrate/nitrite response regulator NarL